MCRNGPLWAIVGTGIEAAGQVTVEARAYIEQADKLFFLVATEVTRGYLRKLNSTAEDLHHFYKTDKDRFSSYLEMIDRILTEVRAGLNVCVAFYGHPGVFVYPGHEAISRGNRVLSKLL